MSECTLVNRLWRGTLTVYRYLAFAQLHIIITFVDV